MKTLKHFSTLASAVMVLTILTITSVVFTQQGVAGGYGYGTCIAVVPAELQAKSKITGTTVLQWSGVDFKKCGSHATATSYTVKIYRAEGGLVKTYSGVTTTQLTIEKGVFKPNSNYKFKVKAIASDSTESAWSRYKLFHTLPTKVKKIVVENVMSTSADVSWNNIARSKTLKYYQVIVRKGKTIVFSGTVSKNLNQSRTGLSIAGLTPNTKYSVKIRSVYTKKIIGKAGSATFKTKARNSTVIF